MANIRSGEKMKAFLRTFVPLVCLIATVQALSAVYSDNTEVFKAAERLACKEGCVRTIGEERTPFYQRFRFQVSIDPQLAVSINCTRSLVLFGEYSCEPMGPAR
jgi:hypothetical protein